MSLLLSRIEMTTHFDNEDWMNYMTAALGVAVVGFLICFLAAFCLGWKYARENPQETGGMFLLMNMRKNKPARREEPVIWPDDKTRRY